MRLATTLRYVAFTLLLLPLWANAADVSFSFTNYSPLPPGPTWYVSSNATILSSTYGVQSSASFSTAI